MYKSTAVLNTARSRLVRGQYDVTFGDRPQTPPTDIAHYEAVTDTGKLSSVVNMSSFHFTEVQLKIQGSS